MAEATKEFDKPLPASRFKPLSRKERERFERARRAGGPDVHRIHAFDIDPKLINDVTAYARRNKMTLSQVVERGLRGVLAFEA
ncbi:MAG: hypothetical protein ACREIT_04250 [Tepidisphaeraceae bacterium]